MLLRDAIRRARVLVVGDVMLDRYWFGDVSRISPEAPVPVVHVTRNEDRIGGAGNVARNAAALGAQVTLLSVAGRDEAGQALRALLDAESFTVHLHEDPAFSTITKLRIIGRQQQLLRVDFETQPGHEVLAAKLEAYAQLLADCDVVILSDYGKGGLTHVTRMIELARAANKPILVDPKGDDWTRYTGATLITPNRSEFREVAGSWKSEAELADKAAAVRASFQSGCPAGDTQRGRHEPVRCGRRAPRSHTCAGSVRRVRRRRHRHRSLCRGAGRRRERRRVRAPGQPRGGHRGRQVRYRGRDRGRSLWRVIEA